MWLTSYRRVRSHSQRNVFALIILIFVVVSIYQLMFSVHRLENEPLSSSESPPVYLCPQLASSSQGYLRVDFAPNFSLNYPSLCPSTGILLIYILSTAKNFDRRQAIRRTWAQRDEYPQLTDICFIFVIGVAGDDVESPLNIGLRQESLTHGDLVQLNLTETYRNVVYKEIGALKWSHLYASHIPFLFKTDDDLIVDTLLLGDIARFLIDNRTDHSRYLRKESSLQPLVEQIYSINKKTLFRGIDFGGQETLRGGKFGVHQLAWNHDHLPGYCSGFGFMFSSFVRDRLYRASLCYATEYVAWVGDLFVSGFLAGTASVRCSSWFIEHAQVRGNCSGNFEIKPRLLVCSTTIHFGDETSSEYDEAWEVIVKRHAEDNKKMKIEKTKPDCPCLKTKKLKTRFKPATI